MRQYGNACSNRLATIFLPCIFRSSSSFPPFSFLFRLASARNAAQNSAKGGGFTPRREAHQSAKRICLEYKAEKKIRATNFLSYKLPITQPSFLIGQATSFRLLLDFIARGATCHAQLSLLERDLQQ
jgi:hypothetical protein